MGTRWSPITRAVEFGTGTHGYTTLMSNAPPVHATLQGPEGSVTPLCHSCSPSILIKPLVVRIGRVVWSFGCGVGCRDNKPQRRLC